MTFEETPEYKLSIAMRPACNAVLSSVFGVGVDSIERFDKNEALNILDREHAIDVRVRMPNGLCLLGQEKTLHYKYYTFRTFTVEFYQNRKTKELGELFKIASQFYLHGYSDSTGTEFIEWKIIDVAKLIVWLKDKPFSELEKRTRPAGGSRATFYYIPYDDIPREFILNEGSNHDLARVYQPF